MNALLKKTLLFVLCAAVLLCSAGCAGNTAKDAETTDPAEPAVSAQPEATPVAPVVLTGTGEAQGFGGKVSVTVTVTDGLITEVTATGDSETAGIGSNAIEQLPAKMVDANSVSVDGVSGATYSSKAVLKAAAAAYALATGAESTQASAMVPGTYQASTMGFNFETVTVSVTVDEQSILSVDVIEHDGNLGIGEEAVALLPSRITEAQSVSVDVITGATVTSRNIIACVTDALSQAKADMNKFTQQAEPAAKKTESLDVDVLVVGSGMAGLAAAVEASSSGADVLVLEQLSIAGGSTVTCGGAIYSTGNRFNAELHNNPQELADYWYAKSNETANYDRLMYVAERTGAAVDWLADLGVEYKDPAASGDLPGLCCMWTTVGGTYSNGGIAFIDAMVNALDANGGKLMLDTKATSLITDANGAVIGAVAEGKDCIYTINSKAVIIASGSVEGSAEMMAKYIDNSDDYVTFGAAGSDGSGILIAEDVGAAVEFTGGVIGLRCVDATAPSHKSVIGRIVFANVPSITENGVRFVRETSDYPLFSKAMEDVIVETGKSGFYQVWDSDYTENYGIEYAVELGFGYKADTLEELAALAGVPADTFVSTINEYNEMANNGGVDSVFGTQNIQPIDNAPYYLTTLKRAAIGTYGGLFTDDSAHVLKEDGSIIVGLYAAGECASTEMFDSVYPASGTMIAVCTVMGRIAGQQVLTDAQ